MVIIVRLEWELHFFEIVIPAWQAYLRAEDALTHALNHGGPVDRTRYDAFREGGAAAFYLHHYADIIAAERPVFLPAHVKDVRKVREWIAMNCRMMRSDKHVSDVALLGDVADALKHSQLTKRIEEREVVARGAVIVIASGMGMFGFGEGKFGGADQVIVFANSGARPLTTILQNVIDAWRRSIGWDLPAVGEA
ncbi:MAG: hypothetical protein IH626_22575 [Rhodospirillales bacterium]|nr:hypothetical protein [Rhodospirillales bacterium]